MMINDDECFECLDFSFLCGGVRQIAYQRVLPCRRGCELLSCMISPLCGMTRATDSICKKLVPFGYHSSCDYTVFV